jgi:hypothetical protein
MRKLSRNRISTFVAFAILAAAGCGPRTGDVVGQVTCDGKTVASGSVMIVASDSLAYHGVIDREGNYTISKVPIGPGKMAVFSPGPDDYNKPFLPPQIFTKAKNESLKPPPFPGDRKKWFPIAEKYQKFEESGLTVTVTSGRTHRDLALVD